MHSRIEKDVLRTKQFRRHGNYNMTEVAGNGNWAFLSFFVLVFIIFSGGMFLMAANAKENSSCTVFDSFLQKVAKGEVTHVEVFYLDWHILTRVAITQSALRSGHWQYKTVIKEPILNHVEESVRKFKFQAAEKISLDFRLGYVFYSKDEELLSLFFAGNMPVVTINGTPFRASPEMFSSLLPFLPHEAYKQTYESLIRRWISDSSLQSGAKTMCSSPPRNK